jgi:transcriptional regulator with XRE-family HTH domain
MNLDEQHYLQSVGLRIRTRREAQNLTQAQLGENCDLDRTFIGSVERGERNIAILNLRKIAQALRVPVQDLLADGEVGGGSADG